MGTAVGIDGAGFVADGRQGQLLCGDSVSSFDLHDPGTVGAAFAGVHCLGGAGIEHLGPAGLFFMTRLVLMSQHPDGDALALKLLESDGGVVAVGDLEIGMKETDGRHVRVWLQVVGQQGAGFVMGGGASINASRGVMVRDGVY